jgi:hypothetical protein
MSSTATMSPPEFAEAQRKIAAYLRACGLYPAAAEAAGASLLDLMLRRPAPAAPASPETAVNGVLDLLDRWPAGLVSENPAETPAQARARVFLADAPARWPEALLTGEVPPELRAAVNEVVLQPAPELRPASMTPQPIDLGPVSEVADGTWRSFDKWPFLRGVAMWTLFALLLCAVFYTVRF